MDGEQIMTVVCVSVITFGISICMIAAAFAARARAKLKGSPDLSKLDSRLDRIEQSLDSVAVEVERVSEAQRFTARILAERKDGAPAQLPAVEERR
ncbi:MAG TPA: hypothetical protein VF118_04220 [Gemmatimonadaceae bacterium]